MSDDLVQRLRDSSKLLSDAADYVAELEDSIQRWRDTDGLQRLRIAALEAALREIVTTELVVSNLARSIARRALETKP